VSHRKERLFWWDTSGVFELRTDDAGGLIGRMEANKTYTNVRLILEDDGNLNQRFEVRVSTFVQFDDNAGRRAVTGHPTKQQAMVIAQEIARAERAKAR
jgi:hypothetical protein